LRSCHFLQTLSLKQGSDIRKTAKNDGGCQQGIKEPGSGFSWGLFLRNQKYVRVNVNNSQRAIIYLIISNRIAGSSPTFGISKKSRFLSGFFIFPNHDDLVKSSRCKACKNWERGQGIGGRRNQETRFVPTPFPKMWRRSRTFYETINHRRQRIGCSLGRETSPL